VYAPTEKVIQLLIVLNTALSFAQTQYKLVTKK